MSHTCKHRGGGGCRPREWRVLDSLLLQAAPLAIARVQRQQLRLLADCLHVLAAQAAAAWRAGLQCQDGAVTGDPALSVPAPQDQQRSALEATERTQAQPATAAKEADCEQQVAPGIHSQCSAVPQEAVAFAVQVHQHLAVPQQPLPGPQHAPKAGGAVVPPQLPAAQHLVPLPNCAGGQQICQAASDRPPGPQTAHEQLLSAFLLHLLAACTTELPLQQRLQFHQHPAYNALPEGLEAAPMPPSDAVQAAAATRFAAGVVAALPLLGVHNAADLMALAAAEGSACWGVDPEECCILDGNQLKVSPGAVHEFSVTCWSRWIALSMGAQIGDPVKAQMCFLLAESKLTGLNCPSHSDSAG